MSRFSFDENSYMDYVSMHQLNEHEARCQLMNICPSCEGAGDHGIEEETGCPYICYACGGTGKFYPEEQ